MQVNENQMKGINHMNTITLLTIKEKFASYLEHGQFLESVFPSFLNEADTNDLLYFIFPDTAGIKDASSRARTQSVFMNGNFSQGRRWQQKALNFIVSMLSKKDTIPRWVEFLKKNYPELRLNSVNQIAMQDMSIYPECFCNLVLQETDPYYLLLYVICWAFLGEQIEQCRFKLSTDELEFSTDKEFFDYMFSKKEHIECIEMAYHSGYKWRYDTQRVNMLKEYIKNGGKLRVIVNTPKAADIIAVHTSDPEKSYIGFENSINSWKELANKYYKSVELIISDIPLMHSYIHFKTDTSESSKMLVIFYTYGNFDMHKNHHLLVDANSPLYTLFKKEFDYLWKIR